MKKINKFIQFLFGIVIMSLGSVLLSKTKLGVAPWEAINFALSDIVGLSTGTCIIILSFLCLIIASFMEKKFINITSFITAVIIGLFMDFWIYLFNSMSIQNIFFRGLLFIIAIIILSIGIAIYLYPNFSANPNDYLMLVIKNKFNLKIMYAKIIFDVICLTLAILFKGPVGIGTILLTLLLGPFVNFWSLKLNTHLNKYVTLTK